MILSNHKLICYQDIWKPVSVRPVQCGWSRGGFIAISWFIIRTDGLDSYGVWNIKHPHWDEGEIRSYDKKRIIFYVLSLKVKIIITLILIYMKICFRSIFLNHSKPKTSTQMLLRDLQMVSLTLRSLFLTNFIVCSLLQILWYICKHMWQ